MSEVIVCVYLGYEVNIHQCTDCNLPCVGIIKKEGGINEHKG